MAMVRESVCACSMSLLRPCGWSTAFKWQCCHCHQDILLVFRIPFHFGTFSLRVISVEAAVSWELNHVAYTWNVTLWNGVELSNTIHDYQRFLILLNIRVHDCIGYIILVKYYYEKFPWLWPILLINTTLLSIYDIQGLTNFEDGFLWSK